MVYVFYEDYERSHERPALYSKCMEHLMGHLKVGSKVIIIADTQWEADDYSYYFTGGAGDGNTLKLGSEVEKQAEGGTLFFKFMNYENFVRDYSDSGERYTVVAGSLNHEEIRTLKSLSAAGDIYTIAHSEEDVENHKKFFLEFEQKNKDTRYYSEHRDKVERIRRKEEERFIKIE